MSYASVHDQIDVATDRLKGGEARWMGAQKMAAFLNLASHHGVVRSARAYTTGMTAEYPIIRRELEAPTAKKRKYEYRLDADPDWPAERVRLLVERTDMTHAEVAEASGCSHTTVRNAIHEGRYFALPLHDDLKAIWEKAEPQTDSLWVVCDVVCSRLVVDSAHETIEAARKERQRGYWGGDTCDARIVRVEGHAPEVGQKLPDHRIEEVHDG